MGVTLSFRNAALAGFSHFRIMLLVSGQSKVICNRIIKGLNDSNPVEQS